MSSDANAILENLFLKDLSALLEKYNATLEAKDHYQGYPECGEDVRMTAGIGPYSEIEIELGRYFDKDTAKSES